MTVIVTLRQAIPEDLEVIHAIRRRAILGIRLSETVAEIDRRNWADRRAQDFFIDRVASGEILVAVYEGNVVGWGSASREWVTGLYVCPAVGLRGVGRRIMASLESRIASEGHASVRLESSPNAVQFYLRLAYVPLGPLEGDGAILMMKALGGAEPQEKAV
jgi:GNAT superfamily N-acetyltransferase